jgi:hypothetical protein
MSAPNEVCDFNRFEFEDALKMPILSALIFLSND